MGFCPHRDVGLQPQAIWLYNKPLNRKYFAIMPEDEQIVIHSRRFVHPIFINVCYNRR